MGLFNRNRPEPPGPPEPPQRPSTADAMALRQQKMALAQQKVAHAIELQAQMTAMRSQAMQQAEAILQGTASVQATGGQEAVVAPPGTGGQQVSLGGARQNYLPWVRQVLALMAPPQAGFVKRCSCVVCGAPKKLPTVTAYVYCDYCASLMDYDLRRACEGDMTPRPEYSATVNATLAAARAAVAAGNRDAYLQLQRKVYEAYATYMPMAVSHRAKTIRNTAPVMSSSWPRSMQPGPSTPPPGRWRPR